MAQLELFFDVGSPASYLAWTRLPALCRQAGAALVLRPMLLGGVFQATGNRSPAEIPAKGRYMLADLARHAERHKVEWRPNPHFPVNTLGLMRGASGFQLHQPERLDAYLGAVFRALWVDARDLNDPGIVAQTLAAAGFEPQAFGQLIADDEVKSTLRKTTEEAVARGVFGAPTMFVGQQMFFGQDRLDFVAEALATAAPTATSTATDADATTATATR